MKLPHASDTGCPGQPALELTQRGVRLRLHPSGSWLQELDWDGSDDVDQPIEPPDVLTRA